MLDISKANQFLTPGQDFYLSSLSVSEKSKMSSIRGEASNGGLSIWTPDAVLPTLLVLRSNRPYLIQSVLTNTGSGVSFTPYSINIASSGTHQQNNQITKFFQFFTYRAGGNFDLNTLSSGVKSKIRRVYAAGSTATGGLRVWEPNAVIPTLRYLISGSTYIVESLVQGFSPYNLGLPLLPSSSSSSSSPQVESFFFASDAMMPDYGLLPDYGLISHDGVLV